MSSTSGLLVDVLRPADGYDCTNGGITSKSKSVILCGEGLPKVFSADANCPALVLVIRWRGTPQEYMHAEPLERYPDKTGPMFGGNFVFSSDSRFPSRYPIPVHDRFN